jgi:hypothetical protein
MILPLLAMAVATLAFQAAGVDIRLCLLFLALFPVAAGVSLARSVGHSSNSSALAACIALASALGAATFVIDKPFMQSKVRRG